MKLPRDLFFGIDSLKIFDPAVLNVSPDEEILILFSKSVLKLDETSQFIEKLKRTATLLTAPVKAEPKEKEIDKLVKKYIHKKIRVVIGIGGGSVLDCAKGVAFGLGRQKVLLVLIPTTAGSGSEITDRFVVVAENGLKKVTLSASLIPNIVILDPVFLEYLPDDVRLYSLVDAVSHAVESINSKSLNLVGRQAASLALETIGRNYEKYLSRKSNQETGTEIQLAAMSAGLALVNGGANVVHALAYAINEQITMSHGQSVSLSLSLCAKIFTYWKEFPWIDDLLKENRQMIFNFSVKNFDIERCLQNVLDNKRLIENCSLPISKKQLKDIIKNFYEIIKTK